MKKNTLLLLILILSAFSSMAQNTIKGFVYDNNSGEAIPFANIILAGTNYGVATDINGFFSINKIPDGKYTLTLRYVGFEDYSEEITLSNRQTVTKKIYIKEASHTLKEVKVKSNREERK